MRRYNARRYAAAIISILLSVLFLVAPAAADKPSFIGSEEWEALSRTNGGETGKVP